MREAASILVRHGGVTVRLYQGREIDDAEFADLMAKNPKLALPDDDARGRGVRARARPPRRSRDIRLHDWHRVYLNSEFTTGRGTFYD